MACKTIYKMYSKLESSNSQRQKAAGCCQGLGGGEKGELSV